MLFWVMLLIFDEVDFYVVGLSFDWCLLIVGGIDGIICFLDIDDDFLEWMSFLFVGILFVVVFNEDNLWFVVSDLDGNLMVWNVVIGCDVLNVDLLNVVG